MEEEIIQYYYNLIQFLSNLSKIISSKKSVEIVIIEKLDVDFITFFIVIKGKKIQKIEEEVVKNRRSKNSYLLGDFINVNEIFGKN